MSSGVKVSDDVMNRFQEMKMGKKTRYMMMVIDGPFVVYQSSAEKTDDQDQDYQKFLSNLSDKSCCFAFLDLTCQSPGAIGGAGKGKDVLFCVAWCPDTAALKEKMLYAATRSSLKDKIKEGIRIVQANDFTDLEYSDLLKSGQSSAN